LHAKNHRQHPVRRRVQRLPKLAFAGRTVAERYIRDFIAVEFDILKLPIIAIALWLRRLRMLRKIPPASAHPTACKICVPVGEDCVTTFSR